MTTELKCIYCKNTGMTGWEKPMGTNPDGSLNMVFIPQICTCKAGDELRNKFSQFTISNFDRNNQWLQTIKT